jgi:hypothetical protein
MTKIPFEDPQVSIKSYIINLVNKTQIMMKIIYMQKINKLTYSNVELKYNRTIWLNLRGGPTCTSLI